MAVLDIVFLVLFIYLTVKGLSRGALADLLSLVAVVAGFFVASRYCVPAGDAIAGIINAASNVFTTMVAFFLIVVAVNMIIGAFARLGTKAVRTIKLGGLNRLLGAGTGFSKASVFFYITCTCILLAAESPPAWFVETHSCSVYSGMHDLVEPVLPSGFEEALAGRFEELRSLLEQYRSLVPDRKGTDTIV